MPPLAGWSTSRNFFKHGLDQIESPLKAIDAEGEAPLTLASEHRSLVGYGIKQQKSSLTSRTSVLTSLCEARQWRAAGDCDTMFLLSKDISQGLLWLRMLSVIETLA